MSPAQSMIRTSSPTSALTMITVKSRFSRSVGIVEGEGKGASGLGLDGGAGGSGGTRGGAGGARGGATQVSSKPSPHAHTPAWHDSEPSHARPVHELGSHSTAAFDGHVRLPAVMPIPLAGTTST